MVVPLTDDGHQPAGVDLRETRTVKIEIKLVPHLGTRVGQQLHKLFGSHLACQEEQMQNLGLGEGAVLNYLGTMSVFLFLGRDRTLGCGTAEPTRLPILLRSLIAGGANVDFKMRGIATYCKIPWRGAAVVFLHVGLNRKPCILSIYILHVVY